MQTPTKITPPTITKGAATTPFAIVESLVLLQEKLQ